MLEVVTNILYYLLFGGCRETGYGDAVLEVCRVFFCLFSEFLLLIFLDELSYVEVIHPEVLPPSREAVGLIDDEPHHMACKQNSFNGLRTKHFRGDVEQGGIAVLHSLDGQCTGDGVEQSIDGDGICDASVGKVVHLVFHQRLQR